jgi:ABC-type multidrug transport system ATPase subunit
MELPEDAMKKNDLGTIKARFKSAAKKVALDLLAEHPVAASPLRARGPAGRPDRRLSEETEVNCETYIDDPCGCGATNGNCEYDDQKCNAEFSTDGEISSSKLGECAKIEDSLFSKFAAAFGFGSKHGTITSCMECPTKDGCSHEQLWVRVKEALEGIKPNINIYEKREDVDRVVQAKGYEMGEAAEGSIKKGDTPLCAALHFKDSTEKNIDVTIQLNSSTALAGGPYQLDFSTNFKWTESSQHARFSGYGEARGYGGYIAGGQSDFMALQKFVERFFLEKVGVTDAADPVFVPMPTDGRKRFGIAVWFPEKLPELGGYLNFGAYLIAICFATTVHRERIQNIRDGLQMMGLTDAGYYVSVHAFYALWVILPVSIVILVIRNPPPKFDLGISTWGVNRYDSGISDWGTFYEGSWMIFFWWILLWHMMSALIQCNIVGCLTNRKPVLYICTYLYFDTVCGIVPEQALTPTTSTLLYFTVLLLIPYSSVLLAFGSFRELLLLGVPLNWSTLFLSLESTRGSWSVGASCLMMPLSVGFWALVYVYLDQVFAAPTPQKWHWPVTRFLKREEQGNTVAVSPADPRFFEETDNQHREMESNNQCVVVRDLVKTFHAHGLTTYAVQGLSMTLYEGEIFCLLGHNGAGKTTAIGCLTGILKANGGSATAFGMSLEDFRMKHRRQVGFCPQHSVLWMELTCLQHLVIFARLKGFDSITAEREAHDVLDQLGMSRKADTQAKALSGGMQRKLSLGIAFVCKPKLVFLDEPSSGMDATARQECWDFLRARREHTVILLTTHYMDEADCLGDRVMVMSAGRAKCCGSGQFLKSAFNCGYMIRCLLPEGVTEELAKDGIVNVVEKFLGAPISGRSGTGTELNMTVRMDQAGAFATMFPELDKLVQDKRLKEWSIAVCSLEEVFLRVASGFTGEDDEHHEGKAAVKLPETKRGVVKNHLQILALFKRRVQYMKRSWLYLLMETVAPGFYVLFFFAFITGLFSTFFSSTDFRIGMAGYNTPLKASTPDMAELIPVVAIPVGDGGVTGTLDGHGFAPSFSVGDDKYEFKMIEMTNDDYAVECDDDAGLLEQWDKEKAEEDEVRQLEEEEARRLMPWKPKAEEEDEKEKARRLMACEPEGRGGRPRDSRLRSLLSIYKTGNPGPLSSCDLAKDGKYLKTSDEKDITDVELVARGFSCWLKKDRLRLDHPESTFGAMMLYGVNGSEVLLVNTSGIHTVPIMQNIRANALAKKKDSNAQIEVTLSTFAKTPTEQDSLIEAVLQLIGVLLIGICFMFPPPFFVAFIVEEKSTGVKGQLLVSGTRGINYWISNYIFDLLPWTIAVSLVSLVFWSYDLQFFFATNENPDLSVRPVYIAICVVYVLHSIPFAYCLAQLFKDPSAAILTLIGFNLFVSLFHLFWQLGAMNDEDNRGWAEGYTWLFRLHPTFCFSEALNVLNLLDARFQNTPPELEFADPAEMERCLDDRDELKNARWDCTMSFWDWEACGGVIYTSLAYGILMMFLVVGLEVLQQTPSFLSWYQKMSDGAKPVVELDEEDEAVREEARKVLSGEKTGPIHVSQVRKSYVLPGDKLPCKKSFWKKKGEGRYVHAVKNISWACDSGDVFGLLGVNGAGKTTMFQMLSGIHVQNEGTIKIANQDMLTANGLREARNKIGYCPQHNPLIGILTVREHLELYGMLKGLSGSELESARDLWIAAMDLKSHQWKLAGNLSGGNKRKLCVAIAMIGDPEIIFLDEPSAGMDPEARRFMWHVIAEIAQTRKQATVVLTTHSMEECEALCNKITIMVNGAFRCIGTHKEVKDLYGQGRELSLKLVTPTQDELTQMQSTWSRTEPPLMDGQRKITRSSLAAWAAQQDPWLGMAVNSAIAPFPEPAPDSAASAAVLSEWYINATNAKKILEWVKVLDESAEWLAWASTTFRFKLYGGGSLPSLFDSMYKNKERLRMMEYAVSPTSLEQIFHAFAKEQTGATENQGVYSNTKEAALHQLLEAVGAPAPRFDPMTGERLQPEIAATGVPGGTKESEKLNAPTNAEVDI